MTIGNKLAHVDITLQNVMQTSHETGQFQCFGIEACFPSVDHCSCHDVTGFPIHNNVAAKLSIVTYILNEHQHQHTYM